MTSSEHLPIEILADHAEGLLADADSASVTTHLGACADCSAELALIASLSEILADDDPGPMPAHFADRIDVALADLAAAEPVRPKPIPASAPSAPVVDLASRRGFAAGARRVSTVAASLVLLIGGAALGVQVLDTGDESGGPSEISAIDTPAELELQARMQSYSVTTPPPTAVPGPNKSQVDPETGIVYLKNKKVVHPDGTIVTPAKEPGGEPTIELNAIPQVPGLPGKKGPRAPLADVPDDPAAPGRDVGEPADQPALEPGPENTPPPVATQPPVSTPPPVDEPPPAPSVAVAEPAAGDPYVTESGETYTEQNFAVKVQRLLQQSGDVVAAEAPAEQSSDSGAASPQSSSTNQSTQSRIATSSALRSEPTVADRGPASAAVEERVKRCAGQLGAANVLAGDVGVWQGQPATIVVVPNAADRSQVIGYVVYGNCTANNPATVASAPWKQRIDKPAAEPEPAPPAEQPAPAESQTRSQEQ